MKKRFFLFVITISFFVHSKAQQNQPVLLTIDDTPVYTSEFRRVYLKNIDLVKDESQKDVDEYLELFINYKLKLKEAQALGLDDKETYKKEFEGYRKQLSANYLTDTEASDALVKQAYDRLQERVNASHILIRMEPGALPADTLKVYNKAIEARNKIINGADFKTVAKEYSEDPSAKQNGGDLGWFTAFRMVFPFEETAYTTPVGEVSMPFTTRFGYHILKVNDREKTYGQVTVAHIMVAKNKERTIEQAEVRIKEINQQLQQGMSFESLAKEFSDDRNTAVNGGKMNRFGQGDLNASEFEKVAFGLKKPNEISKPVKTAYGWHIVKLIEKHEPATFEESKSELTQKVKRDTRSKIITDAFTNRLKKKYGVVKNSKAIDYFKKNIPDSVFMLKEDLPKDAAFDKQLFSIKNKKYTYGDFASFIKKRSSRGRKPGSIDEMYKMFEADAMLKYYEANLESDNEDFANVISEYRDGLLLFDLMETKIWNAAKTDSVALQKYYDTHKSEYQWKERYEIVKATSVDKNKIEKVKGLLTSGKSVDEIKSETNKGDEKATVIFTESKITKGDAALPKSFTGQKGLSDIIKDDNYFTVIQVNNILPAGAKTFEETKGKVINDYQERLEKDWLNQLRQKYQVKVNKKTLKKIKKELQS